MTIVMSLILLACFKGEMCIACRRRSVRFLSRRHILSTVHCRLLVEEH